MLNRFEELDSAELADIERYLAKDPVPNLYLLGDLESRDKRAGVEFYYDGRDVAGLFLRMDLPEYPVIWVIGETSGMSPELISEKRFVMITDRASPGDLVPDWVEPVVYPEDVMVLRKDVMSLASHDAVRELDESDARALAETIGEVGDSDDSLVEQARDKIMRSRCYGYFSQGRIVSRGCIDAVSSYGWVIGGMLTLPDHRSMGYATSVASSIADYALERTDTLGLYVRDDNAPALRSYRKIGFRPVSKRYFVDCGTGSVP